MGDALMKKNGTIMVEMAFGLFILLLWTAGMIWFAKQTLSLQNMKKFKVMAMKNGLSSLSYSKRKRLISKVWRAPGKIKKINSLSKGYTSSKTLKSIPPVLRKIMDYIMISQHEEMEIEVTPYMASFLGEKRKKVVFKDNFTWDKDPMAHSWTLRGLLWGAAFIKAGVGFDWLIGKLSALHSAGMGYGGKSVPTSLPGREEWLNGTKKD